MSIRGGGARVSAWPACRTENGSAVSELRRRSASAASWSGFRADPTGYRVAARASRPMGGLSSGSSPSVRILSTCPHQLDKRKPIQALTERPWLSSPLNDHQTSVYCRLQQRAVLHWIISSEPASFPSLLT